jgi:SAM-dependent methyltransferase
MSPLPVIFGYDLELLFATAILRLKSLHYGFWDFPPNTVTLASVRAAQERFTARLMDFAPQAATVLDVGAGIGDNARALASRGFHVTAISPDRAHSRHYRKDDRAIQYVCAGFEEYDAEERYDLILICESLNYFDLRTGLAQCRRYVAPSGHLLVAAMFHRPESQPYDCAMPIDRLEYVALAKEYGFDLVRGRDVTLNVLPTLAYAQAKLTQFAFPVIDALARVLRVMRQVLPVNFITVPVRRLEEVTAFYRRRTDPEYYVKHTRYAFLLFRDTSPN